jgi:hypothetical protein
MSGAAVENREEPTTTPADRDLWGELSADIVETARCLAVFQTETPPSGKRMLVRRWYSHGRTLKFQQGKSSKPYAIFCDTKWDDGWFN